jgi:RHS repeat-associated protein
MMRERSITSGSVRNVCGGVVGLLGAIKSVRINQGLVGPALMAGFLAVTPVVADVESDEGGGGDDCCGGEQTEDPGEGDVCREEDDCDDCNTSSPDDEENEDQIPGDNNPAPVTTDTGEKWEVVHDLVVKVKGDDFRLTRQYTSDPRLLADPYDSPYIPYQYDVDTQPIIDSDEAIANIPYQIRPVIARPSVSPNVGRGWGFSNLRSISLSQSMGCVQRYCPGPRPPYPVGGTAEYIGSVAWINRPNRKPRQYSMPNDLTMDEYQISDEANGPGNQSVMVYPGFTRTQIGVDWNICTGGACGGSGPLRNFNYTGRMRFQDPGMWKQEFEVEDNVGFMVLDEDEYGNSRDYLDRDDDGIPDVIFLNAATTHDVNSDVIDPTLSGSDAWIELYWTSSSTAPLLARAEVYRLDDNDNAVVTQYVKYFYLDNNTTKVKHWDKDFDSTTTDTGYTNLSGVTPSVDLGKDDDLVQVVTYVAVNPEAASANNAMATTVEWRTNTTQYRYHDGTTGSGDIRLQTTGLNHQLKMEIMPQQIEFAAQRRLASSGTPTDMSVANEANSFLEMNDDATLYTDDSTPIHIYEAAAKIISYDTGAPLNMDNNGHGALVHWSVQSPVDFQFLQATSNCGCGTGSTSAVLRSYEQFDEWSATPTGSSNSYNGQSMQITEHEITSFTSFPTNMNSGYRQFTTDLLMLGPQEKAPYRWMEATIDQSSGGFTWAQENLYDWETRSKLGKNTSSAIASYSQATDTGTVNAPSLTHVASGKGKVIEYGYDDENESVGTVLVGAMGSPTLVSKTIRRSDKTFRKHLPEYTIGYRTDQGDSSAVTDQERTNYFFGFREVDLGGGNFQDTAKVAWKRVEVERETSSENGPGGSVEYWEFFDAQGQLRWEIDPDGVLTKYVYDDLTGELVSITQNALPPTTSEMNELELDGETDPFPSSIGNSDGQLVTTLERDMLGRITNVVRPGGVNAYTARELREDPDRPGVLYYSMIDLPHEITSGEFNGPAVVRYVDAAGNPTRGEYYELDTVATYDPPNGDYTLSSTELTRTSINHDLSGTMTAMNYWWDIANDEYYTTTFEHDGFGRKSKTIDGLGTISEQLYDVLDRPITFKVGTTDVGSTMQTVAALFYDGEPDATPAHGVGNGNVTAYVQYDGENDRITRMYYDERDRTVAVDTPDSPLSLSYYDNLDRVIEQALYPEPTSVIDEDDLMTAVASGLPVDLNITGIIDRSRFTKSSYSQRGLIWRRAFKIDPGLDDTSDDAYLEWNGWFDDDENLLASWAPSKPATVVEYDAHDRVSKMHISDRAGESSVLSFANATSVAGDRILEQIEYAYDNTSGVITQMTSRSRVHDTTTSGALGGGQYAVTSYRGFVYDDAWRRVASINHGTGKTGSNPYSSNAATAPNPSNFDTLAKLREAGDLIYQWVSYNTRGMPSEVIGIQDTGSGSTTSSSDIVKRFAYDDLNRSIAVIENADAVSGVTWNDTLGRYTVSGFDHTKQGTDRVTSVVYDAANHVIRRVAHIPVANGSSTIDEPQITDYVFGVEHTTPGSAGYLDSFLDSKDLLSEVRYPDESTGLPGTTDAYKVKYSYNRLGEIRGVQDQNQTIHSYTRDLMGRVTDDIVNSFGSGSGIDQDIERISYGYDGNGLLETVTSYQDTGTTNVRDQVKFGYTPLWEVETVAQQHDGAVTSSSPELKYRYESLKRTNGTDNYSRVTQVVYPTDNTGLSTDWTLGYQYQFSNNGDNDQLSRVSQIDVNGWVGSTNNALQSHEYIGMNKMARAIYPDIDVNDIDIVLDRTKDHIGAFSSGVYPAFDRYGRVTEHRWVRGDYTTSAPAHANQPGIVEITHTYDRMSNRLTANDARHQLEMPNTQRAFDYDSLNRLIRENRSDPAVVNTAYVNTFRGKEWTLDTLGNWPSVITDSNDDGTFSPATELVDTRGHNSANEIDGLSTNYDRKIQKLPFTPSSYHQYENDDNGNLTEDRQGKAFPLSNVLPGQVHTYDAWNRLVKTEFEPTSGSNETVAEYTYNGMSWRTSKTMDVSTGAYDGIDQKRYFLYDASWRIAEEHIDTDNNGTIDWKSQQFWGVQYIDEAIAKRVDRDADGVWNDSETTQWYQLCDSQYSVVAILNSEAELYERVYYDAYGNADHRFPGDTNDDGNFDFLELSPIMSSSEAIGTTGYNSDFDVNFDGTVDGFDAVVMAYGVDYVPVSGDWISSPTSTLGPDNSIGYAGYVHNPERGDYTVRHRVYSTKMGRWLTKDPLSYFDGANLYLYSNSNPQRHLDPMGLISDGDRVNNILNAMSRRCPDTYPKAMERMKDCMDCVTSSASEDPGGGGLDIEGVDFLQGVIGHLADIGAVHANSELHELGQALESLYNYMKTKGLSNTDQLDYIKNSTSYADEAIDMADRLRCLSRLGNVLAGVGTAFSVYDVWNDPTDPWAWNNAVAGGALTGTALCGAKVAASITVVGAVAIVAAEITALALDKYWDAKEAASRDGERNGYCSFLDQNLDKYSPCGGS